MYSRRRLVGVGLMSGSSLDGLDLALCQWDIAIPVEDESKAFVLDYELLHSAFEPFDTDMAMKLKNPDELDVRSLQRLDVEFGLFIGQAVNRFLKPLEVQVSFVASHGHTVLHEPEQGYSLQIGNPWHIAKTVNLPVVADFRNKDIAFGGQGAPMACLVDRYLFPSCDVFLNLGGIANISYVKNGIWQAYDIGVCNQFFNKLAHFKGKAYDDRGQIAASGEVIPALVEKIMTFPFFEKDPPKSLDNTFIRETLWPVIDQHDGRIEDKMATCVAILTQSFCRSLLDIRLAEQKSNNPKLFQSIMISGGGAKNTFLVNSLLREGQKILGLDQYKIDESLADMKEAMLMSLAGAFRILELPNFMASASGASQSTSGGAIYLPQILKK